MQKTSKRNLIRCVIFLLITGVIVLYLNLVFTMGDAEECKQTFNTFYAEKDNTLDGVYFGASSSNRYWIGPLAYAEEGITIGSLSTTSQPLVLTKYLMEEAEKTQNPKLFVVELRWAFKSADNMGDAFIRKVTDSMKWSMTRIRAINEGIDFSLQGENDVVDKKLEYYIPIIKYHGRWNDTMTKGDILLSKTQSESKGFFLTPGASFRQVLQPEAAYTTEKGELAPETEAMIVDLLDYCDSIDTEVLFVLSPHAAKEKNLKKLNRAVEIVEARGYPVLNCNTPEMIEALGINWSTDFFNANHTNCMGAEKYTRYLAAYIAENYDLSDHREDPDYDSWQKAYEYYVDYTSEKKSEMSVE